ncbi:MAG: type I DNA topoisomerase [Candidatus Kerfeldbacteria bacterium]|nr:type I DNA topoisomerase [Candidatus Kerfeldbacteria bacterium]
MSTNLVIVESPTKAKTISRFLGKEFEVLSSYGHVRDLPKSKLGVDVEHDFAPQYVVPLKAKKVVAVLKAAAAKAKAVYFATDEDREGEAISWHLVALLKTNQEKIKRIAFHEITEEAIKEALAHPRQLDQNLVDAQQARRILDRLVGYELSPFLWKKVAKGLSAGRVQSVAVRLIVEREREITAFQAQEYWTIAGQFKHLADTFTAQLIKLEGQVLEKFSLSSAKQAETSVAKLEQATGWQVMKLETKPGKRQAPPPYTTSTLQQDANRILGFSAKQTMMLAQKLYEGVDLSEGAVGLITYMRTDSTNLAEKFLHEAQVYIKETWGPDYARGPRRFATKNKNAQEAHEAIRPTEARRSPENLKDQLEPGLWKLYNLIWRRTLASQLPEALFDNTTLEIADATKQNIFRTSGSRLTFDGFLKVALEKRQDELLPELTLNDDVTLQQLTPEQHFTEAAARYSEATLVKALESYGIGRPSTYAPTISTIIERGYVERVEKRLRPTDLATVVNDVLVEHFPEVVDYEFTARIEEQLDNIAGGAAQWVPLVRGFYQPFKGHLNVKYDEVSKKEITETATKEICEKCGSPMVIKLGRFGKFLACSNYPDCRNTKHLNGNGEIETPEATDEKCPDCGAAMVVKRGRFGKFLACSKYPECKGVKRIVKTTGVKCPECKQGDIVERRSKRGRNFYSCSRYPECKFALWSKPTGEICPKCQSLLVYGAKNTIRCSNKECDYKKEVSD